MESIEYSSYSESLRAEELDAEVNRNSSSTEDEEAEEAAEEEEPENGSRLRQRKSRLFPHVCHQDSLETLAKSNQCNGIDININNTYLS